MVHGEWCISSYDKSMRLFSSLMETNSGIHVELGDDAKYVVKGEGTLSFWLESRGLFDA